jgi:hypothetical protein
MTISHAQAKIVAGVNIPEGWYVHEAGQDKLHMLWFAILLNFDDVMSGVEPPRHAVGVECVTFEGALTMAVSKIESGANEVLVDVTS